MAHRGPGPSEIHRVLDPNYEAQSGTHRDYQDPVYGAGLGLTGTWSNRDSV